MLLKRYKTGACHRFFCALQMLSLFGALSLSQAQILLPDQVEVPPVDVEGAGPESPDPSNEEEVQRTIQQMQRNRSQMLPETLEPPLEPGNRLIRAAEQRYESAVERVRVFGQLRTGESFQGELKNRSFPVQNPIGRFPLRLGELQQCRRVEGTADFVFDLRGGDRVTGRPQLEVFVLQTPEGGMRVLPLRDIIKIDFLPAP